VFGTLAKKAKPDKGHLTNSYKTKWQSAALDDAFVLSFSLKQGLWWESIQEKMMLVFIRDDTRQIIMTLETEQNVVAWNAFQRHNDKNIAISCETKLNSNDWTAQKDDETDRTQLQTPSPQPNYIHWFNLTHNIYAVQHTQRSLTDTKINLDQMHKSISFSFVYLYEQPWN